MIVTTMNDIPGYAVDEVYGEVFGLTVRSRNMFSNLGAGFKAMAGGELKGLSKSAVTPDELPLHPPPPCVRRRRGSP